MQLAEFLKNPIGKGDASIPNKAMMLASFDAKYRQYITLSSADKKRQIQLMVFKGSNETYYYWLIMPSENTDRDNTYDVVFKFFDKDKSHKMDLSIAKYDFQVFTNTPAFAYTYAYVYNQHDILVPELANKLGKEALTTSPDVRNRNQLVLFDKYIYYAGKYLLELSRLSRDTIEATAKPFNKGYLISHIRTLKVIFEEYRVAEEKAKQKRKAAKAHAPIKKLKINSEGEEDKGGIHIINPHKKISSNSRGMDKIKPIQKRTKGTIRKK